MITELLIILGFFWVIGWAYSIGAHKNNIDFIKVNGTNVDIRDADADGGVKLSAIIVLFFIWPNYLGANSGK